MKGSPVRVRASASFDFCRFAGQQHRAGSLGRRTVGTHAYNLVFQCVPAPVLHEGPYAGILSVSPVLDPFTRLEGFSDRPSARFRGQRVVQPPQARAEQAAVLFFGQREASLGADEWVGLAG
jgi:hypothetical protein